MRVEREGMVMLNRVCGLWGFRVWVPGRCRIHRLGFAVVIKYISNRFIYKFNRCYDSPFGVLFWAVALALVNSLPVVC